MANDFLIPTNQIQQQRQVGVSSSPPDIGKPVPDFDMAAFAGLSKSLSGLGGTLLDINKLEGEQAKVMQQYKAEIEQVAGLMRARSPNSKITEDNIRRFTEDQEGRIQRRGIIKAYENFVFQDSVAKSRSKQRLSYFQEKFNEYRPQLTNPTKPASIESVESIIWEDSVSVAMKDVAGNPLDFDISNMSTGELVEFTAGLNGLKYGIRLAVDEVKHKRAIEVAGNIWQEELFNVFKSYSAQPYRIEEIEAQFNTAYNSGVEDINKKFFGALNSFAESYGRESELSTATYDNFMNLLNDVQGGVVLRKDDKGNPIMFAPEGTENHLLIEKLRDSFTIEWGQREREESARYSQLVETAETTISREVLSMINRDVEDDTKPVDANSVWKHILKRTGEASEKGVFVDPDKLKGQFDSILTAMEPDAPSNPTRTGIYLREADRQQLNSVGLKDIEENAFEDLNEGVISLTEYNSVRNSVTARLESLNSEAGKIAERFSGDYNSMVSDLESVFSETLKQNNFRRQLGFDPVTRSPIFETVGGHDDRMSNKYRTELERFFGELHSIVISGGELEANYLVGFSPVYLSRLEDDGFDPAEIRDVVTTLNKPVKFDGEITSAAEFMKRKKIIEDRARAYSTYLAMKQVGDKYPLNSLRRKTEK